MPLDTDGVLYQFAFKAMGSPCQLQCSCESSFAFEAIKKQSVAEMKRLERKYSRYLETSLVSQINRAAGTKKTFALDPETWAIFQYATAAFEQSEGLFDITSGVFRRIWDFNKSKIPSAEDRRRCLDLVGWHRVTPSQSNFRLPKPGMEIDLGGIVKEYAADALAELIKRQGIESALVDLGGDIAVVGPRPNGEPWPVGIRHPVEKENAMATIPLSGGGLASSGDYERFFELDGERYSHIINPLTGWPVKGLSAVSVWAPACVVAGSVATIAMLKPIDEGLAWLQEVGSSFVAIDQEGKLYGDASEKSTFKEPESE